MLLQNIVIWRRLRRRIHNILLLWKQLVDSRGTMVIRYIKVYKNVWKNPMEPILRIIFHEARRMLPLPRQGLL